MSQSNDAPKKSSPATRPATETKASAGSWRDPARRRSFSLGVRGQYPSTAPTKS